MRKIAAPLVAGALALVLTSPALAATPRADAYYTVVCDGTAYESVDARSVELGGKDGAVALFSQNYPFDLKCSLEGPFTR